MLNILLIVQSRSQEYFFLCSCRQPCMLLLYQLADLLLTLFKVAPKMDTGLISPDSASQEQQLSVDFPTHSSSKMGACCLDLSGVCECSRWYGPCQPPNFVFVERKTHQESWKGEESVKERCMLKEDKVVSFLEGEYTAEDAVRDLRAQNKPEEEIESFEALFEQIQQQVDSKQLRPLIRTQYMRTAFQVPFDDSVRISLDTNLVMLKENPDGGPSTTLMGRWCRDPALPIQRTEITHFPHAVLEVKLSLQEGDPTPAWVQELLDSGLCTEVYKFSKFIHGTATLFPDMVQAVPYWVDDESVRPSMLMSAPSYSRSEDPVVELPPSALDLEIDVQETERYTPRNTPRDTQRDTPRNTPRNVPRLRLPRLDELRHPLLADEPSISLIGDDRNAGMRSARSTGNGFPSARSMGNGLPSSRSVATGGNMSASVSGRFSAGSRDSGHGFFTRLLGLDKPKKTALGRPPMRVEPKTFFANERTYLAWLNMAITVGSIAIALLGFGGTASRKQGQLAVVEVVEINALILLPLALLMSCYAMFMFIWRSRRIARLRATYFDDRVGPLGLSIVTGASLLTIFGIGLYDYIRDLKGLSAI
ncbi:unnamed protein product [Ostreobium quekettii]|uniref:Vacuolar transporter chaperone 4 n=1 Tax=Ostreobium quekettii TaxID=121088 RepID=A0A8S1JG66_9CHLO|nr:unnamed protein product [Ostreobium quekettii]